MHVEHLSGMVLEQVNGRHVWPPVLLHALLIGLLAMPEHKQMMGFHILRQGQYQYRSSFSKTHCCLSPKGPKPPAYPCVSCQPAIISAFCGRHMIDSLISKEAVKLNAADSHVLRHTITPPLAPWQSSQASMKSGQRLSRGRLPQVCKERGPLRCLARPLAADLKLQTPHWRLLERTHQHLGHILSANLPATI